MISDKWIVKPDGMEGILDKVERIASCYGFSSKELLQIRLLCEETLSVLSPALQLGMSRCWIHTDSADFAFHVMCSANQQGLSEETRKRILSLDKGTRKGGVFGAIGKALEALFTPEYTSSGAYDTAFMGDYSYYGLGGCHYSWRPAHDGFILSAERSAGAPAAAAHDDDGLEISIVEGYADDIKAALRSGGRLEVTVAKRYSNVPDNVEFTV